MTNHINLISKSDLHSTVWVEALEPALGDGQVRLKIDAFALTANNVTYAVFGAEPLYYWNFFPSPKPEMGRVPVWGFATVQASNADGVSVGQRVYGYFPISSTLDVTPAKVSARGFIDSAAHRAGLAPVYNGYAFTDTDPAYQAEFEAEQMLFRPLYMTGWMICDSLLQSDIKPDTAIISSASSKTAIATAHALKSNGVKTIGLTSPANIEFVKASGLFDETVLYADVAQMNASGSAAYVDFSGRPALTREVHMVCGDALKRSLVIGVTDWQADRTPHTDLPGPAPEFFFVPDYAAMRTKSLPAGELDKLVLKDLIAFMPISRKFITAETIEGQDAITDAWLKTVDGKIAPTRGLICKF